MKVKELIDLLQKENPESEVISSGRGPIYFPEWKPGYYDGHTPILIHDEKKKPYYSIVGYKWEPNEHGKVVLQCMELEDCLYNCNTIKQLDDFIIQGADRYLEGALELKEKVKEVFKSWDKK
jgi:hypothetical protein